MVGMEDHDRRPPGPLRSLLRDRGYLAPALFAVALALALGVAYLALARPAGLRLVPRLLPPEAAPTTWGPPRPGAVGPEEVQLQRLTTLLSFLALLTATAMATAGLTVLILASARAARRRGELALRSVLGATRRRLLRLLAAEGAAVAVGGGLVGLLGGLVAGGLLLASWPARLAPTEAGAGASTGVALALIVAAVGTAVLTLVPLLAVPREGALRSALALGERISAGRPERFLRSVLVVVQLGASVALLTAAGLLVRRALPAPSPPDFGGSSQVLTVHLQPTGATPDTLERVAFYRALLKRARELTTVEAESLASPGAWVGLSAQETAVAECGACVQGGLPKPLSAPEVREHAVSPGYFATLGLSLLEGRAFTDGDGPEAPLVAVVSRSLARSPYNFEDGDPLGRQIQIGGLAGPWLTIVGIVEDRNPPGLGSARAPPPTLYVSAFQFPPSEVGLAVRVPPGGVDPEPGLREIVRQAGLGSWATERFVPLEGLLREYRAPITWIGWLLLVAGGVSLVLAVHGLYAVTVYHVRLRRREMGIRMALGADGRRILRLVLAENLKLLAAGGLLGAWAGLGLGGALQDLGVPFFDPVVTGVVLGILVGTGVAGSWRPARAAASVEPAVTLSER